MQTGDPRVYDAARANSRHSMDVDNIHWPADPIFSATATRRSTTGSSTGAAEGRDTAGLAVRRDRRAARAAALGRTLSAHVWTMGWIADYYLSADHRGLDVAIQTADMYLKRIWGEHGLTGRRLYLGLWNVLEVWDATKDPRYRAEADDYVDRILQLAGNDQGGSLTVDRYGYADVYVTHALGEYRQLTGDARVAAALARHARRLRDVPPLNHEMESYMSSVYGLVLGLRADEGTESPRRVRTRIRERQDGSGHRPFDETETRRSVRRDRQGEPSAAERDPQRRAPAIWSATNGLRVFGWTMRIRCRSRSSGWKRA